MPCYETNLVCRFKIQYIYKIFESITFDHNIKSSKQIYRVMWYSKTRKFHLWLIIAISADDSMKIKSLWNVYFANDIEEN